MKQKRKRRILAFFTGAVAFDIALLLNKLLRQAIGKEGTIMLWLIGFTIWFIVGGIIGLIVIWLNEVVYPREKREEELI